jgi:serine protease Do
MKKHTVSCFVLFFFSSSVTAQFSTLVAKVEKAVFHIQTFNEFGLKDGSGTGFFIDSKGTGLTAHHVLEEARFAFIKDYKGRTFRIKEVTRVNEKADLAEFTIESANIIFPFIPMSTSIPLKGSDVFTIGFPEDFERVVTKGIISATQVKGGETIIQTSTPISHGSSGSPLLNMQGQAIGVMSYSITDGQNLNFASAIGSRSRLTKDAAFDMMSDAKGSYFFINQTCKSDPNLHLVSIERTDSSTVFNFVFSNISIAFGDGAFIYCTTENRNQTFHINDFAAIQRYYLQETTLAGSIEEASPMKMGNVKSFKLIFDRIPELTTFDLKEGMPGGDWSFNQLSLPKQQVLTKNVFEDFMKEHLFFTAFDIKYERYEDAIDSLQKYRQRIPANERLERFSAIAYFENQDYDSSAASLERALVYLPEQNSLYADLYEVEMKRGNTEKALEAIEKAIELEPTYIEYYLFRARAHENMEHWSAAIVDYSTFIDAGRDPVASIYFARGMAKARIKDPGACADIDKAKELAESDREWDRYQKAFREFCK